MNAATDRLALGFTNPVDDSQQLFRGLLTAMSEPGQIGSVAMLDQHPGPLGIASFALALTLLDRHSSYALTSGVDRPEVRQSIAFHCNAPLARECDAPDFLFCREDEIPALERLNTGSEAYPDQSTTLVVQCQSLEKGPTMIATGPGIAGQRVIACSAIGEHLVAQRERLQTRFPLGIDMIFTRERAYFCLPRTTRLRPQGHGA